MLIQAVNKRTKAPLNFESTTADANTLADVDNPGKLPELQKLAYFARRSELLLEAKLATVNVHKSRLDRIFKDILDRALGPEDDEVHQKISEARLATTTTLESFRIKAANPKMKFEEMELIQQLRGGLITLKDLLPDPAVNAEHQDALNKTRKMVSDVLARSESGIRAWVQGASIAYRGSLATGWRNARKSDQGKAQRVDLLKFDCDAFVSIPHETWVAWKNLKIVLDNKVDDKMSLADLMVRAQHAAVSDEVTRVRSQLEGIKVVEGQLQLALQSVPGYKLAAKSNDDPGPVEWTDRDKRRSDKYKADFELVLQTSNKTVRELKSGNLYPLGEIANAGLPLTENDLDVVIESQEFWVRMPERHISMSVVIGEPTYKGTEVDVAHTVKFPTERMQIENYFASDDRVALRKVVTVEKQLMDFIKEHSPHMTFDSSRW